jgi:hypothetical protein
MGRPTYLIAKFVPDLFRNEPVNVGVIVWIDGRVESKFIAQRPDGEIDGRFLPREIKNHTHVYKQWIDTWRKWTAKDKISPIGHSEVFLRGDAKFMEALQSTGKGNYILESGGEILEDIISSNIGEVVEHLFIRLVEAKEKEDEHQTVQQVRDGLLNDANVSFDSRIKTDQPVEIKLGTKTIHPEFHVYIGNGTPLYLAQVVDLNIQAKKARSNAESIARRFSNVHNANIIPRDRSYVFVVPPEAEQDEKQQRLIDESITELNSVTNVLDVTHARGQIISNIQKWVEATPLH